MASVEHWVVKSLKWATTRVQTNLKSIINIKFVKHTMNIFCEHSSIDFFLQRFINIHPSYSFGFTYILHFRCNLDLVFASEKVRLFFAKINMSSKIISLFISLFIYFLYTHRSYTLLNNPYAFINLHCKNFQLASMHIIILAIYKLIF